MEVEENTTEKYNMDIQSQKVKGKICKTNYQNQKYKSTRDEKRETVIIKVKNTKNQSAGEDMRKILSKQRM